MDGETSDFTKTNVTRCFRCRRCCDKDLRRFGIGVSFTKTGDIDVSNFTVKDGCNSSCTSTTNGIISNVLTVINNVHRRCIGVTFTARQQFNICDSTTSNLNIENLCANRIDDTCSRNSFITLSLTNNINSFNSAITIQNCLQRCSDSILTSRRIQIDLWCCSVVLTTIGNLNRPNINPPTSQSWVGDFCTTRIDKLDRRNLVITRTRRLHGQFCDTFNIVTYRCNDSCSLSFIVCRRIYLNDGRVVCTITLTREQKTDFLDTINKCFCGCILTSRGRVNGNLRRKTQTIPRTTILNNNILNLTTINFRNCDSTTTKFGSNLLNRTNVDALTIYKRSFEDQFVFKYRKVLKGTLLNTIDNNNRCNS